MILHESLQIHSGSSLPRRKEGTRKRIDQGGDMRIKIGRRQENMSSNPEATRLQVIQSHLSQQSDVSCDTSGLWSDVYCLKITSYKCCLHNGHIPGGVLRCS